MCQGRSTPYVGDKLIAPLQRNACIVGIVYIYKPVRTWGWMTIIHIYIYTPYSHYIRIYNYQLWCGTHPNHPNIYNISTPIPLLSEKKHLAVTFDPNWAHLSVSFRIALQILSDSSYPTGANLGRKGRSSPVAPWPVSGTCFVKWKVLGWRINVGKQTIDWRFRTGFSWFFEWNVLEIFVHHVTCHPQKRNV